MKSIASVGRPAYTERESRVTGFVGPELVCRAPGRSIRSRAAFVEMKMFEPGITALDPQWKRPGREAFDKQLARHAAPESTVIPRWLPAVIAPSLLFSLMAAWVIEKLLYFYHEYWRVVYVENAAV